MSKQEKESSEGSDNSKEMPCIPEGTKPLDKQCLSKELATLLKVKTTNKMTRGQVIKNIWSYINEHNLQDPNDTAYIIPDEKMAAVFGKERFLGFSMATYLEKHYNSKDPSDFDTECKSEGLGPLDKQCLSHELTSLLNVDEDIKMTRGQVVKRVWNYIDEHELKEPKNARYIIPDEKMSAVFGKGKFLGFSMAKYLEKHYKKENIDDNAGEGISSKHEGSYNMEEDFDKFEQTVDKKMNEIGVDKKEVLGLADKELAKFWKTVEENMNAVEADLKEGIHIVGEELSKLGQIVEEKIDVAEVNVKEDFDHAREEIEKFGQILEEKIDLTEENIKEGLDHTGEELETFGENVEKKLDAAEADIKEGFDNMSEDFLKFWETVEKKMNEIGADMKEGFDFAGQELAKFGKIAKEKIDVANGNIKEGFDHAGEEFKQFGQMVEGKKDVTEENIKEGLDHASKELEKFGQNIQEKMDAADAVIKEGFVHADMNVNDVNIISLTTKLQDMKLTAKNDMTNKYFKCGYGPATNTDSNPTVDFNDLTQRTQEGIIQTVETHPVMKKASKQIGILVAPPTFKKKDFEFRPFGQKRVTKKNTGVITFKTLEDKSTRTRAGQKINYTIKTYDVNHNEYVFEATSRLTKLTNKFLKINLHKNTVTFTK